MENVRTSSRKNRLRISGLLLLFPMAYVAVTQNLAFAADHVGPTEPAQCEDAEPADFGMFSGKIKRCELMNPQFGTQGEGRAKCNDLVIVQIGDIELGTPRYDASVTLDSDQPTRLETLCGQYNFSNVRRLDEAFYDLKGTETARLSLYDPAAAKTVTTYEKRKQEIEQAFKEGRAEDSDGMRKIALPGYDLYLLPLKTSPTANDEPVVLECVKPSHGVDCSATYFFKPDFLPSKLAKKQPLLLPVLEYRASMPGMIAPVGMDATMRSGISRMGEMRELAWLQHNPRKVDPAPSNEH